MRLYILRHGEAASPTGGGESTLTAQGRLQAVQAAGLVAQEQPPTLILHSPRLRALQTMAALVAAMPGVNCEMSSALLPEGSAGAVENLLANREHDSIALVSHLPLVAALVGWFSSGDSADFRLPGFSPAGLVAMDVEIPARGCGAICYHAFSPDHIRYDHPRTETTTGDQL